MRAGSRNSNIKAKEAPRQRSRSSAAYSRLRCSAQYKIFLSMVKECELTVVNSAGRCTVCYFAHARPISLASTSYWGERERAPSSGINGFAIAIERTCCILDMIITPCVACNMVCSIGCW